MNRTEEAIQDLEREIRELTSRMIEVEVKLTFLRSRTVPRMDFDALLEYLKLDWKTVHTHVEFFPKKEE